MTDQAVSKTLIELLDAADPSSVAIRVPGGPSVTYDSLKRQVYSLAGQLKGLGIVRNDRVAIVMPNSIESIISFLGVSAVATAAPPIWSQRRLRNSVGKHCRWISRP